MAFRLLLGDNQAPARSNLLDKASREAEAGRRLAIFDRQTGLLAYWYFELRGSEEVLRAGRYDRPLTLLIAEDPKDQAGEAGGSLSHWLRANLRGSDLLTYLGTGRYLFLAPETDYDAAAVLIGRLKEQAPSVFVGAASFPDDGKTISQLRQAADAQIQVARQTKADGA